MHNIKAPVHRKHSFGQANGLPRACSAMAAMKKRRLHHRQFAIAGRHELISAAGTVLAVTLCGPCWPQDDGLSKGALA